MLKTYHSMTGCILNELVIGLIEQCESLMFDKSQFTMFTMKVKEKNLPVKKKDKKTRFNKLQYPEINFMTISCKKPLSLQ